MPRKAADPSKPKTSKRRPRQKLPKFTQKRAAGRPMIYEAEPHCARAKRLALLGLTDLEIAEQFGIAYPVTFDQWKKRHPEFAKALQDGKVDMDAKVAESMAKRALGYDYPAVKIFMPQGAEEPVYAPYMEHYPGDVGAQKSWLFNRQGMRWRDRQQVEVSGTLEHRIAQMTPEERIARLRELQEKVARSLTIEHAPGEGER